MANPDVGAVTMGITGADHWLWWEHGGEKLWRRGQGGSRESRRQSNDSQARKQRNVLSLAGRQSDTLSHSGWQKQHPQQARKVKQCPQCHQRGKLITILILSKAKQWGIIRAESHKEELHPHPCTEAKQHLQWSKVKGAKSWSGPDIEAMSSVEHGGEAMSS